MYKSRAGGSRRSVMGNIFESYLFMYKSRAGGSRRSAMGNIIKSYVFMYKSQAGGSRRSAMGNIIESDMCQGPLYCCRVTQQQIFKV